MKIKFKTPHTVTLLTEEELSNIEVDKNWDQDWDSHCEGSWWLDDDGRLVIARITDFFCCPATHTWYLGNRLCARWLPEFCMSTPVVVQLGPVLRTELHLTPALVYALCGRSA